MKVSIAGGSGFVGGELCRWLLGHPELELGEVTSQKNAGAPIASVHPHLRGRSAARFVKLEDLNPCDALMLALPHGHAAREFAHFESLAPRIVDCSADFRLRDGATYERWYGEVHPRPELLDTFVYGLPELTRERLRGASRASGVGCNATAATLALLPLECAGLLSRDHPVVVDVKVGSSEGGARASASSHHPLRSGCVRSYAPVGHRHTAEIEQAFGGLEVALSITAVELVRGALATCHVRVPRGLAERDLLRAYQQFAEAEPFVDFVRERRSLFRVPEPKLVAGTNRAQIGFALDADRGRVVSLCAIDNLGKGAAGTAVQALNLMCGLDETAGLAAFALHPS
jgi:N-acetyl-gamma-glutamyl-phosphate/LysW-gamma-L-alpha-aminoadipyl-6-phosphate reductase